MTDRYQNKYRIASARLKNWDYRWAGVYFISICTHNREQYFGNVTNGKMELSHIGIVAYILWYEIVNHTPNVELGEFVVMPNHIHGILILNGNDILTGSIGSIGSTGSTVETLHATSLQSQPSSQSSPQPPSPTEFMAKISPKTGSVSTIIRSYKSAVTKYTHRLGFEFEWQPRFHDHIIRDDKSYQNISEYIMNNPAKWQDDKFYEQ